METPWIFTAGLLNRDWHDEWGGQLELWDRQMTRCAQRISPQLNRCVIFQTDRTAFHGHPEPLVCPPKQTRKSLALYYYSNDSVESAEQDGQVTAWQRRPSDPEVVPSWADKLVDGVRHPLQTARRLLGGKS
ncbi:MAG: 2OG-Fe(II) oxygenase [Pirellulaceae bacterium]